MADGFQVGDVVTLKSGGPAMTIQSDNFGQFICAWFVGTDRQQGQFAPSSLIPYEDAEKN